MDSNVQFVKNLSGGGKLFSCINAAGVPYSFIEKDGVEYMNCEKGKEKGMITCWNRQTRKECNV